MRIIKNVTREAVLSLSTYDEISKNVNKKIRECKRPHRWHIIVYSKDCGESLCCYDAYYIDMSYGDMRFEIFTGGTY
jgi:hypothetical protein